MNDLVEVVDAKYLNGYKILVQFDDGKKKIVDLQNELNGKIFLPLKNIKYFQNFSVNKELGIIQWPNEADFAPEHLYSIGENIS